MSSLLDLLGEGVPAQDLSLAQVSARAVIVFFAALVIVRIANKRFFAKQTAFDVMLAFILGSMLARAINGSERLVPTIAAGLLLAVLHNFLALLSARSPQLGSWLKGSSTTLIEKGLVDHAALRRHHLGDDDLREELRLQGVQNPAEVHLATLERSGSVSVIKKEE